MSSRAVVIAAALGSLLGCSTILKGPYDTPGERTAKTWKRFAHGVGTLGTAEIRVVRRQRQYARHWTYWYDRITLAHAVEAAQTHQALTQVFGGIPECSDDGDKRLCQWTADSRTYALVGSGFWIYSSAFYQSTVVQTGGEMYRLICALPADGSARIPGSCTHLVNGVRFTEDQFRTCLGRWPAYCPRFEDVISGAANRNWQRSGFIEW
jgi:hypothetical protein